LHAVSHAICKQLTFHPAEDLTGAAEAKALLVSRRVYAI